MYISNKIIRSIKVSKESILSSTIVKEYRRRS